jgi:tetratricopeptide (TPR) repeat protein
MKVVAHALIVATLTLAGLALPGCRTPNPQAFLTDGDLAFDATQYVNAAESYEQYLALREGDWRVRRRLAQSYLWSGDYDNAVKHARLIYTQRPGDDQAADLLAEALFKAERPDELFRVLRSEAQDSQQMVDWMRLGDYASKLGDRDSTQVAYLAAARVSRGSSIKPYIALFDHFRNLGDRPNAIRVIRYAAWVDRNDSKVADRIKLAGLIDGPTLPLQPPEARGESADLPATPANPAEVAPAPAPTPAARPTPRPAARPGPGTAPTGGPAPAAPAAAPRTDR